MKPPCFHIPGLRRLEQPLRENGTPLLMFAFLQSAHRCCRYMLSLDRGRSPLHFNGSSAAVSPVGQSVHRPPRATPSREQKVPLLFESKHKCCTEAENGNNQHRSPDLSKHVHAFHPLLENNTSNTTEQLLERRAASREHGLLSTLPSH